MTPLPIFSKYRQVLSIGVQSTLAYRINFLCRSLFALVPLTATILLWRAIYAGAGDDVAGYALEQMISYYLVITMIDTLTAVNEDDWQIVADIRDGRISQFLLKPIGYLGYRLTLYFSGRLVYWLISLLPIGCFVFFYRENLQLPADPTVWSSVVLSVALTALLQFFISFSMALLAFWVLEIDTFIFILFAIEVIAGGHLFPLDILPAAIMNALAWTPFPYLLYFPASIFLERTTGTELLLGLGIQIGWTLIAFGVACFVWRRGVRQYEAAGG